VWPGWREVERRVRGGGWRSERGGEGERGLELSLGVFKQGKCGSR
jgi:hypothetical protein